MCKQNGHCHEAAHSDLDGYMTLTDAMMYHHTKFGEWMKGALRPSNAKSLVILHQIA